MKFWIILLLALFGINIVQAQEPDCNGLPIVTFDHWGGNLDSLRRGFCVDDTVNLWYQDGLPTWQSHNAVPLYFSTRAIWQDYGAIEASAGYNGVSLEGFEGAVALNSCDFVGSTAWIRRNAAQRFLRVVAADCAAREHVYFHTVYVLSGIELSYQLAEYFGEFEESGVGLYGFEVCTATDVNQCVGVPVDYRQWFLDNLIFM